MSLFHTKEWWSHKPELPSECSPSSLLVCNIDGDSSSPSSDKVITGSFSGHLRIFAPSTPPRVEDLLLETNLDDPILQVECGRFVAGTSRLALAVLFPKKLSVFLVNAVKSSSAASPSSPPSSSASYFDLSHSYTHRFHHHAYSMTYGPFGQAASSASNPSSRDHLAVLTLDGQLLFFEQDTFAFSRYLPGFLFPGAFLYVRQLDSFLVATAANEVECYRYSVLGESHQTDRKGAAAEEAEESKEAMEAEFRQVQHAKKLHTDWTANLGEAVLDIAVGRTSPQSSLDIVVLTRHSLWVLKDNGAVRQTKRVDYAPLSLTVFPTQAGVDHVLVGTEERALFLYADLRLLWACRTTLTPVTARVAQHLGPVPGLLCLQSDTNELLVAYLGTDPPLQAVSTSMSKELDYDGMDTEHRKLLKVMKQAAGDKMQEPKDKLIVKLIVPDALSEDDATRGQDGEGWVRDDAGRPVSVDVTVALSHTAVLPMSNVHVTLSLPLPFVTPSPHVVVASLPPAASAASAPHTLTFPVYVLPGHHCHTLCFDALASYTTPDSLTRTALSSSRLPLAMYGRVRPPVKNTAHFFTLDCNKPPPPLPSLFPDLFRGGGGVDVEASASVFTLFTWGWGEDVTVLVSKKSGRYRLQGGCYHAFGVLMAELVSRLTSFYQEESKHSGQLAVVQHEAGREAEELVLKFEEDLPLNDFFPLLERHHAQRAAVSALHGRLTRLSQQFRAVQKRLLVRYKDKNPTPLLHFDVLLTETYDAIVQVSALLDTEQAALSALSSQLAAASQHLVLLLSLKHQLDRKNQDALRQVFHLQGGEERALSGVVMDTDAGSGWEERLDASLIHVLRFVLTKAAKPEEAGGGGGGGGNAEVMKDVGRLKKHLVMLNERLARGLRLVAGTKDGAGKAAMQSPGTPPASASGGRRGEERRRQASVDMREATHALVEVDEEETA